MNLISPHLNLNVRFCLESFSVEITYNLGQSLRDETILFVFKFSRKVSGFFISKNSRTFLQSFSHIDFDYDSFQEWVKSAWQKELEKDYFLNHEFDNLPF